MSRSRSSDTLAIVRRANELLERQYRPLGITPTVRQLFYALAVENFVEKSDKGYNRVQRILVDARGRGEYPWGGLADHLREVEQPQVWDDFESYLETVRRAYRLDRWALQPERVELWLEKDTVRGTVAALAEQYQVPLLVARGYPSSTAKFEACQRIAADERTVTIIYVGDHDPSGINMLEGAVSWMRRRISRAEGFTVDRVAITDADRDAESLLSFLPVNVKDSRAREYIKRFGPTVVEVEALAPEELQRRVRAAIELRIDWAAWQAVEEQEAQGRARLKEIAA